MAKALSATLARGVWLGLLMASLLYGSLSCGSSRRGTNAYKDGVYDSVEEWRVVHGAAIGAFRELRAKHSWEFLCWDGVSISCYSEDLQTLRPTGQTLSAKSPFFLAASHDGRYFGYVVRVGESTYDLTIVDRESGASASLPVAWDSMNRIWNGGASYRPGRVWSHSDARFAYVTRDKSAGLDELHIHDALTGADEVIGGFEYCRWLQWSPSDEAIAFIDAESEISVIKLADRSVTKVGQAGFGYDWVDANRLIAANREHMVCLYSVSGDAGEELFKGKHPLSLAGGRIAYRLDGDLHVRDLDSGVVVTMSRGQHGGGPTVITVSPCRHYILVSRTIRIKGYKGLTHEGLVLDEELEVRGATLKYARPCEWVTRPER